MAMFLIKNYRNSFRLLSKKIQRRYFTVLGIETSCDDTGVALVDSSGNILGESLYSQNAIHVRYGGVVPIFANEFHRDNIENAVSDVLIKSCMKMTDINAVAVTTHPGLIRSLKVGVTYANYLAKQHHKELIPIHHMQAHALIARMYHDIPFPFLVLLISGGHCLLAVAQDTSDFLLLGHCLDNAPGEILDKVARRMKLKYLPEYSKLSGGEAIELAAKKSNNPSLFQFPLPLARYRDCNFSFSGLKDSVERKLLQKEVEHGISNFGLVPETNDLCASFQKAVTEHIIHRTQRAINFCEMYNLITKNKNLVISGGVASNDYIYNGLQFVGNKLGYKVHRPPRKVCTDNGIMIAWNGIEKLRSSKYDLLSHIDLKTIQSEAPIGKNLSDEVKKANIPVKVIRL